MVNARALQGEAASAVAFDEAELVSQLRENRADEQGAPDVAAVRATFGHGTSIETASASSIRASLLRISCNKPRLLRWWFHPSAPTLTRSSRDSVGVGFRFRHGA